MNELKKVNLDPVQLSIEANTRLLVVKQGDNEVKLTRDSVKAMRSLRNGEKQTWVNPTLTPRNKFTVSENGFISIVCKDDWASNVVIIANHKKLDDLARIEAFVDKNRPRIAWERDFRGRY